MSAIHDYPSIESVFIGPQKPIRRDSLRPNVPHWQEQIAFSYRTNAPRDLLPFQDDPLQMAALACAAEQEAETCRHGVCVGEGFLAGHRPQGWLLISRIETWICTCCSSPQLAGISDDQRCAYCRD